MSETEEDGEGPRMRAGYLMVNYQQVEVNGNERRRDNLMEKRQPSKAHKKNLHNSGKTAAKPHHLWLLISKW